MCKREMGLQVSVLKDFGEHLDDESKFNWAIYLGLISQPLSCPHRSTFACCGRKGAQDVQQRLGHRIRCSGKESASKIAAHACPSEPYLWSHLSATITSVLALGKQVSSSVRTKGGGGKGGQRRQNHQCFRNPFTVWGLCPSV